MDMKILTASLLCTILIIGCLNAETPESVPDLLATLDALNSQIAVLEAQKATEIPENSNLLTTNDIQPNIAATVSALVSKELSLIQDTNSLTPDQSAEKALPQLIPAVASTIQATYTPVPTYKLIPTIPASSAVSGQTMGGCETRNAINETSIVLRSSVDCISRYYGGRGVSVETGLTLKWDVKTISDYEGTNYHAFGIISNDTAKTYSGSIKLNTTNAVGSLNPITETFNFYGLTPGNKDIFQIRLKSTTYGEVKNVILSKFETSEKN
jgi:hypothetical protein